MSKFTPGPWTLGNSRGKKGTAHVHAPDWAKFAKVVVRMAGDVEDCDEGLANARLIMAAPDLYEVVRRYAALEIGGTHLLQAAKDALAKARGEA